MQEPRRVLVEPRFIPVLEIPSILLSNWNLCQAFIVYYVQSLFLSYPFSWSKHYSTQIYSSSLRSITLFYVHFLIPSLVSFILIMHNTHSHQSSVKYPPTALNSSMAMSVLLTIQCLVIMANMWRYQSEESVNGKGFLTQKRVHNQAFSINHIWALLNAFKIWF